MATDLHFRTHGPTVHFQAAHGVCMDGDVIHTQTKLAVSNPVRTESEYVTSFATDIHFSDLGSGLDTKICGIVTDHNIPNRSADLSLDRLADIFAGGSDHCSASTNVS